MFMSQEKLQTMSMQSFLGVKEVHYGTVQVVNCNLSNKDWSFTTFTRAAAAEVRKVIQ